MKILICFGTRPEWLKIKPLLTVFNKKNYDLLFTGQHQDLLKDIDFDYEINIFSKNNRLDDILISCMSNFPKQKYDYVLVQGDTGSALGCALAAYNRKIKIIHLEAGLRTYDDKNPYPEESYRQLISRISDINLCPTELSLTNLNNEKVKGKSFVVGNTVLDNLYEIKKNSTYGNKVLITLHRRENHEIMETWFKTLNDLSEKFSNLEFIFPIHPNPNVKKFETLLSHNIKVIEPLEHKELVNLLLNTKFVITDSGGIQEESSFLNKKVIVCRKTTERPEGIETGHIYLCESPDRLIEMVHKIDLNYYIDNVCPYGDGQSSIKILNILINDYSNIERI
jgi:UDP-N-acetylglucosamine 2-epimerase (non-hydrolysing)